MDDPLRVVMYSDDSVLRRYVIDSVGSAPHPALPDVAFVEVVTLPALIALMEAGGVDVAILDGEATPAGGMGVARQLRDELDDCPPILVLIARAADAWLAQWSNADATVGPRRDPIALADAVSAMLPIALARRATNVTSRLVANQGVPAATSRAASPARASRAAVRIRGPRRAGHQPIG
jgi:CheY-like chemotaxis protein